MRNRRGASLLLVLLGCSGPGEAVKVQNVTGPPAAARPPGCALDLLYARPARPYRALGELTSVVVRTAMEAPAEVLRDPACALGADAVIVTRNATANHFEKVLVAGTAIAYLDGANPPVPER